jgi:phosphopantothenate-cysteine ligase
VTGGGTVAPIDDVRRLTNASSGRFSSAITEACMRRGATVWHVHTPTAEVPFRRSARFDLELNDAQTAAEHARLDRLRRDWQAVRDRLRYVPLAQGTVAEYAGVLERLLRAEPVDVVILAMAVSDYEPEPVEGKLTSDPESLVIRCRRTPKVIRSVRDWAPGVFLVGFKLLSGSTFEELIRRAEEANRVNRADLTVANDLSTLRAGRHTVHLVRPGHPTETLGPGPDLADELVGRVLALADRRRSRERHARGGPGLAGSAVGSEG